MRVTRSASQILFGYLPEQTVDLNRGVWKVKEWRHPVRLGDVDTSSLIRELKRVAAPWRANSMDHGFCQALEAGATVQVLSLDRAAGVKVEPFPETWFCPRCKRMLDAYDSSCRCGSSSRPQQLHFVGTCDQCGSLREPYVSRCRTHNAARIRFPGTASAEEILFDCPECERVLQRGFGFPRCSCGNVIVFNVHRAASVFTPRSVVIVNPPSRAQISMVASAGGPARALDWVLGGMTEQNLSELGPSAEELRQSLLRQNFPPEVIEKMLEAAGSAIGKASEPPNLGMSVNAMQAAQEQAVTIALAASESRVRIKNLMEGTDALSELGILYRDTYAAALQQAGLEAVELIDEFPVLTGHFGYTRGKSGPGQSKLIAYRDRRNYQVYGEIAKTEALFVRLDPMRIHRWLSAKGFNLGTADNARDARLAILRNAVIPGPGDPDTPASLGTDLLTLIHTYAHRFIRVTAVCAGIDRNALSELLVPLHLGFYVYAAARGDFVLGGLQALFESELNLLLNNFAFDELRCPLDPGCMKAGGACMACVHLGEPSCRYFNRFLSRSTLMGTNGYLELGIA